MANFPTHIAIGTLVSGTLATLTLAVDAVLGVYRPCDTRRSNTPGSKFPPGFNARVIDMCIAKCLGFRVPDISTQCYQSSQSFVPICCPDAGFQRVRETKQLERATGQP